MSRVKVSGDVIYIFPTMDTKLFGKTWFYSQSENSPSYVIDSLSNRIEAYQNQSGSLECIIEV